MSLDFIELTDIRQHLGLRIRYFRERIGFSQEQLALDADVSQPTVNRLERGLTWPDFATLRALSSQLGVEIEEFFAGMDHKPIRPTPEEALEVLSDLIAERRMRDKKRVPPDGHPDLSHVPREILDGLARLPDDAWQAIAAVIEGALGDPDPPPPKKNPDKPAK